MCAREQAVQAGSRRLPMPSLRSTVTCVRRRESERRSRRLGACRSRCVVLLSFCFCIFVSFGMTGMGYAYATSHLQYGTPATLPMRNGNGQCAHTQWIWNLYGIFLLSRFTRPLRATASRLSPLHSLSVLRSVLGRPVRQRQRRAAGHTCNPLVLDPVTRTPYVAWPRVQPLDASRRCVTLCDRLTRRTLP